MDPSAARIDAPFHEAMDAIVFRAVLSFVAVAAIAAVPLLFHLPPGIHEAAHAALPAVWTAYAAVTWLRLRRRSSASGAAHPAATDPWATAAEADPGGARSARLALGLLPVGWLAAALGLLAHHLSTTMGQLEVLGIDVPVLAIAFVLATWAWRASCSETVARAAAERDHRLRDHLERLRHAP